MSSPPGSKNSKIRNFQSGGVVLRKFFCGAENKHMTTGLGLSACTLLLIVGALVLGILTFSELARMRESKQNGTCGAGLVKTQPPSAKRSNMHATSKAKPVPEFSHLDEDWQNNVSDETKHTEMAQDNTTLLKEFTWEATLEDQKKFDDVRVDTERARRSANTKGISASAAAERPRYTKKLGMNNPLMEIYHSKSESEDVKFGKTCSWFNATDAYLSARADSMGVGECDY